MCHAPPPRHPGFSIRARGPTGTCGSACPPSHCPPGGSEALTSEPRDREGRGLVEKLVLSLLAPGETVESLLEDYPDMEADDIRACLAYAHAVIAQDSIDAVRVAHR